MPLRVRVSESYSGLTAFQDDDDGEHLLLTVDEYNSIVRQLNLIKLAIGPLIPEDGVSEKLRTTNNLVVE